MTQELRPARYGEGIEGTIAQHLAARRLFAAVHPEHKHPATQATYMVDCFPSATTRHMRVTCACGYMARYPASKL